MRDYLARRRSGEAARRADCPGKAGIASNRNCHGAILACDGREAFREFRRRQPDAEPVPHHLLSIHQVEAVLSGRLEAGFAATITPWGKDLAHWEFRTEFYLQRPEAIH